MRENGIEKTFTGRVVAVPQTRQLDVLASLLASRGATVVRCPLVAIEDAPDSKPIEAWLRRMIAAPADLTIFYTGEGIERLLGFAERAGIAGDFTAALARTLKLCRGPKPKRVLRRLGLSSDIDAAAPTTAGIVLTLDARELDGKRVAVQVYGDGPVDALADYLNDRGATADFVAPYVYVSSADDAQVAELIEQLANGKIDAVTFTSKTQFERLLKLARDRSLEPRLRTGLGRTCVAAVGPVVAATLKDAGIEVHVTPEESFSMKPLVAALAKELSG